MYSKFTGEKIKKKGLVHKSDNSGFIDNSDLDRNLVKLATKAELKAEQDKIVKIQTFDSSYFRRKCHFYNDGMQSYLVFSQSINILKRLLIVIKFQRGNLKDCLMRVINFLLHLTIVLHQL